MRNARNRIVSAVAGAALLALVMVACNAPTDAQPAVDLAPIEEALARVEGKIDALASQIEQVSAGIVDLNASVSTGFGGVASDFADLQDAALDLQALVSAPIDLSRVERPKRNTQDCQDGGSENHLRILSMVHDRRQLSGWP